MTSSAVMCEGRYVYLGGRTQKTPMISSEGGAPITGYICIKTFCSPRAIDRIRFDVFKNRMKDHSRNGGSHERSVMNVVLCVEYVCICLFVVYVTTHDICECMWHIWMRVMNVNVWYIQMIVRKCVYVCMHENNLNSFENPSSINLESFSRRYCTYFLAKDTSGKKLSFLEYACRLRCHQS